MNNSIETAQASTGIITAGQLREVVRYGVASLYTHATAVSDRPSYSDAFTFVVTAVESENSKTGFRAEKTLTVPGFVHGGATSHRKEHVSDSDGHRWMTNDEGFRPEHGFWSLGLTCQERILDILDLLPKDAAVAFEVGLDYGTNEYLIRAECPMDRFAESGLHADSLFLIATHMVRGKEKVRRFLLATQTTPHNSARFGSPTHSNDKVGRRG